MTHNKTLAEAEANPQSPELREIFETLGLAISLWNNVEFGLLCIFCRCLEPAPDDTVTSLFWSIKTFEAKLNATHTVVVKRYPNDVVSTPWRAMKSRCQKLQAKRNALAHAHGQQIIYMRDGQFVRQTHLAPGGMAWMSQYSVDQSEMTGHWTPAPGNKLAAEEVRSIAQCFAELGSELCGFASCLPKN